MIIYTLLISFSTVNVYFAQQPDRYLNEIPQQQCTYTFQVPSEHVNTQCLSSEMRQYLEQIRTENQQILAENAQLKAEIQNIIKEYGYMVETVKKLDNETATWREIVEWPIYDVPFLSDELAEIINSGETYDDCLQAVKRNNGKQGIYTITPRNAQHPHLLYCDPQGWTVVLRRLDGKVNFNRLVPRFAYLK